jgi:hypothetical protein
MVGLSISHVTGTFVVSPSGLSEVSTAQSNGTNHRIANAMSTPMQTPLKRRLRVARRGLTGGVVTWPLVGVATAVIVRPPFPGAA